MAASLGQSVLKLITDDREFSKGIAGAREKAQKLQAGFIKVGAALTAVGAGFVAAAKHAIDLGDEFAKTSQQVGVSVEQLSALRHAAELSGTSFGGITRSLQRLSKNLNDASNETGIAQDAFAALGIQVTDAEGNLRGAQDVMLEVAARFSEMEDGSKKTALAMDIFGRSGVELIPFLNQGRDGIRAMTDEAASLGLVMSTETAQASERFNDAMTRLTGSFQGLANTLIETGLLDRITEIVNSTASVISNFAQAHPLITQVIGVLGLLAAAVGPVVIAIGLIIPPITTVITAIAGSGGLLAALGSVVAVLTGPVGIAVAIAAAIVALGALLAQNETVRTVISDVWSAISTVLTGIWETIRDTASKVWDAVGDKVSSVLDELKEIFDRVVANYQEIWEEHGDEIQAIFEAVWEGVEALTEAALSTFSGIGKVLSAGLDVLLGLVKIFAGSLTGDWELMGEGLQDIWTTVWNAIKGIVRAPIDAISTLISGFTSGLADAFSALSRTLQDTWRGLWDAIEALIRAPIETIKNLISGFTGSVSGSFSALSDVLVGNSIVPAMMTAILGEFSKLSTVIVPQVRTDANMISGIFSGIGESIEGERGLLGSLGKLGSPDILSGLGDLKGAIGSLFSLDIQGAIGGFINQFRRMFDFLIDFIAKVIDAVNVIVDAVIEIANAGLSILSAGTAGILGVSLVRLISDIFGGGGGGRHDAQIEENTRFTFIDVEILIGVMQESQSILWRIRNEAYDFNTQIRDLLRAIRGKLDDIVTALSASSETAALKAALEPAGIGGGKAALAGINAGKAVQFQIFALDNSDMERTVRKRIFPELERLLKNRRVRL